MPARYILFLNGCLLFSLGMPSLTQAEVRFERIQLSDEFYSEGGTYGDYDGDGHGDVAVGPWIYYGPDFERRSQFYEGESIDPVGYSNNFLMYTSDVNRDGRPDILVLGFPGKESWWYENPGQSGAEESWPEHVILDSVDNESPLIADIDGDGIDDLICSSGGHYGYASHAGQDPTEKWQFHKISPNNGYQRFTHGLGIGDVNNDGRIDLLEKDGWWENPGADFAGEFWPFHAVPFSSGGSQMYALDLTGDGRNEVLTGLAAHGYGLVYYRAVNDDATQFEHVDIMTDSAESSPTGLAVSQLHAVAVADINADGLPDIVTGKRWWAHANKDPGHSAPATLLWLEMQRSGDSLRFIPHVIDNSSGVGTQVTVGDVNQDGLLDIVCGIKRGAYLFLQRPADLPSDQWLVPSPAEKDRFAQRAAQDIVALDEEQGGFVPALEGRPLNFDFESGDLSDWEIRGPIKAHPLAESRESQTGRFYVDTGSENPQAIGELISRPFVLHKARVACLIAGKPDPEVRVELISELSGRVLASTRAPEADGWQTAMLEASEAVEQLVRLRIVDHSNSAAIRVDNFRLLE